MAFSNRETRGGFSKAPTYRDQDGNSRKGTGHHPWGRGRGQPGERQRAHTSLPCPLPLPPRGATRSAFLAPTLPAGHPQRDTLHPPPRLAPALHLASPAPRFSQRPPTPCPPWPAPNLSHHLPGHHGVKAWCQALPGSAPHPPGGCVSVSPFYRRRRGLQRGPAAGPAAARHQAVELGFNARSSTQLRGTCFSRARDHHEEAPPAPGVSWPAGARCQLLPPACVCCASLPSTPGAPTVCTKRSTV